MKLKTYYSDTVEAAMRIAKVELGHEAVLVGSRESQGDASKGKLQVTFARPPSSSEADEQAPKRPAIPARHWKKFVPRELNDEPPVAPRGEAPPSEPEPAPRLPEPSSATPEPGTRTQPLNRRIDELAAQVGELRMLFVSRSEKAEPSAGPSVEQGPLLSDLMRAGVEPQLAKRILSEPAEIAGAGAEQSRGEARRRLVELWNINSDIGLGAGTSAVALVGPCGAGKTTAAARLAVRYGLELGLRAELICVDPLRVGAVEAVEAYSKIVRAPLTVLQEPEDLPAMVEKMSTRQPAPELILIDTPGHAPAESGRLDRLAAALRLTNTQTHLVLSAATASADLRGAAERYSACRPSRLLFTRVDEGALPGSMLNESLRSGLPLSFVGTGPRLPDDLSPASAAELSDLVLAASDDARGF